ncbi:MAG: hypothetical protein HC852_05515 [Acaryochloridaceae cyanobacterium RU_4_10]|nr:hypothetical protein [Acaryochloridaceae cyanobacterium RU_4_10]
MDALGPKLQTTRATSLEDVYKTLRLVPLQTPEEIAAFYKDELNETRGGDQMKRLRLGLNRAYGDVVPFKACLMGHPGVGKSTELSRLIADIEPEFRTIRFSATSVLDPVNFRPLDVLLIMMMEVAEQTTQLVGTPPSASCLRKILDWFATDTKSRTTQSESKIGIEAGIGVKSDSLWSQIVGLFANTKGEIRFASAREEKVVEYRLSRLDDLLEVANELLDECTRLLQTTAKQEWLFIGEDFDKARIATHRVEELFITYGNIFQDLRAHLIFSVPIGLYYSVGASQLPFTPNCSFIIPDTPVYTQDHFPNNPGREAVLTVLEARMDLNLFEADQVLRLIVASGGNVRDLFTLVNYAADSAILRTAKQINADDVLGAIFNLRSDYERRLGQSPFSPDPVSYSEKAALLEQIYAGTADAQITNPAMYSLLGTRAVQEFNGKRWFGVHPIVVDILKKQGHLPEDVEGGTI